LPHGRGHIQPIARTHEPSPNSVRFALCPRPLRQGKAPARSDKRGSQFAAGCDAANPPHLKVESPPGAVCSCVGKALKPLFGRYPFRRKLTCVKCHLPDSSRFFRRPEGDWRVSRRVDFTSATPPVPATSSVEPDRAGSAASFRRVMLPRQLVHDVVLARMVNHS